MSFSDSTAASRQAQLEQALLDAIEGKACWLPRARQLLRKRAPMAEHEAVVERIRGRAVERWACDPADLRQPTENTPDQDYRAELVGYVWACIAAARALGVPRKTVELLFSASESTVNKAQRRAALADLSTHQRKAWRASVAARVELEAEPKELVIVLAGVSYLTTPPTEGPTPAPPASS